MPNDHSYADIYKFIQSYWASLAKNRQFLRKENKRRIEIQNQRKRKFLNAVCFTVDHSFKSCYQQAGKVKQGRIFRFEQLGQGGCFNDIYIINKRANMEQSDHQRNFNDFLQRIQITDPHTLKVDLDSLRSQHQQTATELIKNPAVYYRLAKSFLQRNLLGQQKQRFQAKIQHYRISFQGNLGANFVSPRGLTSKLANELVGVQGIITKMDIVKYYLQKSVHFCQKTKAFETKEYPDNLNPEKDFQPNKTRHIITHDQDNNPLSLEYGMSSFRNIQSVVIQELPEMAPPGLLPQSVTVILQGSLVNSVKPGDRVQMIGIYKLVGGSQSTQKGIFKPYFICLSVRQLNQSVVAGSIPKVWPFDKSQIVDYCCRSVAPSIYGHQELKKAVLLMLLGGEQKNLQNGTHLRGDINLLMVGDPGTAKSQMLRWVMATAELSIGTTGSGASGVGLTAAVVTDKDTGEKTLEAGAMVLADRGVVCIDQFDKMNEADRVAVHEVMEQQTVTIAKAGMHCSLNARCSVIAAANPIYGEYQTHLAPTKNVGMPDSLLSRFDLVFIVLDQKSAEKDRRIAERVTRNHRLAPKTNQTYNQFNEDDDYIIHPNEGQAKGETGLFEKHNIYQSDTKSKEIFHQAFLKKFISHCKHDIHPELTDQAIQLLSHMWSLLRQEDLNDKGSSVSKVLPVTIRSFQTLIRLSTAHAKLHQSETIELRDCVQAFRLVVYSLYGGDKHALDDKLKEIFRKLNLEDGSVVMKEHKVEKGARVALKKEGRRMEDETAILIQKVSKIDLLKDDRDAEAIIKMAMLIDDPRTTLKKESKSLVFKALVALKNHLKANQTGISFKELIKKMEDKSVTNEEIGMAIKQLDEQGQISYDSVTQKIFI